MPERRMIMGNIGPREQRRRFTIGIIMFAVAAIIVAGQMWFGWSKGWRLLTVLPFFAGMLGLLQAHKGT